MPTKQKSGIRSGLEWFHNLKPCDFRRTLIKSYLNDIRKHSRTTKNSIIIKYQPSNQHENTINILTRYAGSSLNVVRTAIQELDLSEVLDTQNTFDIVWCGTSEIPELELANRYINKFPGAAGILSKISLFRALELNRRLLPKIYRFYPRTWFLPFQKQALVSQHKNGTSAGKPIYIVKPDSGTQGRGIYLIQSPTTYTPSRTIETEPSKTPLDFDFGANWNGLQPALDVVQRYEHNPVLLNGCKTDLRVYALIESLNPLIVHVYRDGLVRVASRLYERPERHNLNKHTMHLTNYAINKLQRPPGSQSAPTITRTPESKQTNEPWRCKHSLRDLLLGTSEPGSANKPLWSHIDADILWAQIDEVIRLTVFSLVPHLKVAYWAAYGCEEDVNEGTKNVHCFQILGFDFLLVEPDHHPVLLEVNSNPSLRTDAVHSLLDRLRRERGDRRLKSQVLPSTGLIAELATMISSVLGDRYAEFERSSIDERVKGGLIRSTLELMCRRVEDSRRSAVTSHPPKRSMRPSLRTFNSQDQLGSSKCVPGKFGRSRKSCVSVVSFERADKRVSRKKTQNSSEEQENGGHLPALASQKTARPPKRKASKRPSYECVHLAQFLQERVSLEIPPSHGPGRPERKDDLEMTFDDLDGGNDVSLSSANEQRVMPTDYAVGSGETCNEPTSSTLPSLVCIYIEGQRSDAPIFSHSSPTWNLCQLEYERVHKALSAHQQASQRRRPMIRDGDYTRWTPSLLLNLQAFDSPVRVLDILADLFIYAVGPRKRRSPTQTMSPIRMCEEVSDDWTSAMNVERRISLNFRTNDGPRMDSTVFRGFCRRCKIDQLGLTQTELDLVFAKHRDWWHRVYDVKGPVRVRDRLKSRGITFPAFLDLCVQLADQFKLGMGSKRRATLNTINLPEIPLYPNLMTSPVHSSLSTNNAEVSDLHTSSGTLDTHPEPVIEPTSLLGTSMLNVLKFVEHCCTNL